MQFYVFRAEKNDLWNAFGHSCMIFQLQELLRDKNKEGITENRCVFLLTLPFSTMKTYDEERTRNFFGMINKIE